MTLKLTKVMLGYKDHFGAEASSCIVEEAPDIEGDCALASAIILTLGKHGPLNTGELEKVVKGRRNEEVTRMDKSLAEEGRITAAKRGKATVYALLSNPPSDPDVEA